MTLTSARETAIAVAIAITATKKQKVRKRNDLYLPVTPDNLHPWRDRREVEYKNMTEEEVFDRIANAMERIAGAMEMYVQTFCIPQNVGVPCSYDEIQHVSYDDAQLGREK